MPVVFRRRFQLDVAGGFDWYEEQRPGLGEEFLAAVQTALKSVELYPDMFLCAHGEVRRAIVPRFPFAIFYLVESRRVVILRALHTARDPKLWPKPRN